LFAAARARLADGGLLAGSLERADGAEVHLAITGRYQHGRGYLERLAAAHELAIVALDAIDVRLEAGRPAPGWLFVLAAQKRPA
jgi:predicted TPR repeat methyltransferase